VFILLNRIEEEQLVKYQKKRMVVCQIKGHAMQYFYVKGFDKIQHRTLIEILEMLDINRN